ncbi:MAG: hypothetical protein ACR2FY_09470 [Pirellulaceae bacterium]
MKLPRLLSLSLIFLLVFAASAQAEWWKPSMPNLNPFKRRDSHPANIGNNEDSWQWPGMSRKPAAEPQEAKPSVWQRVSSGTKSTWIKTKSTLTPWRAKPQPEEELVVTGANSSFSRMANGDNKQPVKKAFWAWGNEEDERPQKASSVSDFIGGRRPE